MEDYDITQDKQNSFRSEKFPEYPEHIPHDKMTCDTSESDSSSEENASIEIVTHQEVDGQGTADLRL